MRGDAVLVHLASGVGNVVLATALLRALDRHGYEVDVLVDGDYPGIGALFHNWSVVRAVFERPAIPRAADAYALHVPAIPPFYWPRYAARYAGMSNAVRRPPDQLFYRDERRYYLEFAYAAGCDASFDPDTFLPVTPGTNGPTGVSTLAIAPGCKSGEMATKRWPHFAELAEAFADVVLVGTADDLRQADGVPMRFPAHVRSYVDRLSLRETAELLAAAGAVVANDSGLGHVAAATGVPTVLLFGPTPHRTLGRFPPNATILHASRPCAPCWFGARFGACERRIDCLSELRPETVVAAVRSAARLPEASRDGTFLRIG